MQRLADGVQARGARTAMLVTAAAAEGRCAHVVLDADVFIGHCCFPQSARFVNVVARKSTLQLVHSVSIWPWQHAKVVEVRCDECEPSMLMNDWYHGR